MRHGMQGIPFILRDRPLRSQLNIGKRFSKVLRMRGSYGDALAKATVRLSCGAGVYVRNKGMIRGGTGRYGREGGTGLFHVL
jgi:hypothetical protein